MLVEDLDLEADLLKLLKVFQSKVRIEIVKLLLRLEWVSLSDISKELESE